MNPDIEILTKGLRKGSSISQADFIEDTEKMDFPLPDDYSEFIKCSNGAEGFIGSNFLRLWKVEDLDTVNADYSVDECAPGYFVFGSNGGGSAYAFDKKRAFNCII